MSIKKIWPSLIFPVLKHTWIRVHIRVNAHLPLPKSIICPKFILVEFCWFSQGRWEHSCLDTDIDPLTRNVDLKVSLQAESKLFL